MKYNAPVAALAFSADGAWFPVGVGYAWDVEEEGTRTAERPALFVHELGEEVVREATRLRVERRTRSACVSIFGSLSSHSLCI
jgi:hypothetical protein